MTNLNIIWSGINSLIIILLSIFGKLWADKKKLEIQNELNKELEQTKSSLSKERYIHRLQFEKEFRIYEELWRYLIQLQDSVSKLIPIADICEPGRTKEEIKKERLQNVQKDYNKVQKSIKNYKPFYSEKVYKNANEILKNSIRQVLAIHYPDRDVVEYFTKAQKRTNEINEIIYKIEKAIRDRIHNMGKAKLLG